MPNIGQFDKRKLVEVLQSPNSFATEVALVALDLSGPELLHWDPATIRKELHSELGLEVPSVTIHKIMSIIGIVTTDTFFKSVPHFKEYCNILSGDMFDPNTVRPPDSFEIAWGITEGLLWWPPDEEEPFSDEIRYSIGIALKNDGFQTKPDVLGIALMDDGLPDPISEFADDPEMYSAAFSARGDKDQQLRDFLRENLSILFARLKDLPLVSGSTQNLVQQFRAGLK